MEDNNKLYRLSSHNMAEAFSQTHSFQSYPAPIEYDGTPRQSLHMPESHHWSPDQSLPISEAYDETPRRSLPIPEAYIPRHPLPIPEAYSRSPGQSLPLPEAFIQSPGQSIPEVSDVYRHESNRSSLPTTEVSSQYNLSSYQMSEVYGSPDNTPYSGHPGNPPYPGHPGNPPYPGHPSNTPYPRDQSDTRKESYSMALSPSFSRELESTITRTVTKLLNEDRRKSSIPKIEPKKECKRRKKASTNNMSSSSTSLASLVFDKIAFELPEEGSSKLNSSRRHPTPSASEISRMINYTKETGFKTCVQNSEKIKDKLRSVLMSESCIAGLQLHQARNNGTGARFKESNSNPCPQTASYVFFIMGMLASSLVVILIGFFTGIISVDPTHRKK